MAKDESILGKLALLAAAGAGIWYFITSATASADTTTLDYEIAWNRNQSDLQQDKAALDEAGIQNEIIPGTGAGSGGYSLMVRSADVKAASKLVA